MQFNVGDSIAGYTIVAQVGSGGMATVYQAYQERLDRHVAIKVLHDTFAQDDSFLERFAREARIVARLEHPHIVPIYDYAEYESRPYFVMKFIEGGTLKRRLIKRGITLDEIMRMLPMLADALTYAHEKGVLHRDIKPSNILIDERDLPYVSDFGLARIAQVSDSTISHDLMIGTPHYISPEQAKGERELTPATDVYSFGIILYELLLGRLPFTADTPYAIVHEHIYNAPTPPSQINPELSAAVDAVLLKALSKVPTERYQTATALMDNFRLALAESGLRQLPPDRSQVGQTPPPAHSNYQPQLAEKRIDRSPQQRLRDEGDPSEIDRLQHPSFPFDLDEIVDMGEQIQGKIESGGRKRKGKNRQERESAIRERVEKKIRARRAIIVHLVIYSLLIGMIGLSIIMQGRVGALQDLFMFAGLWGIFPSLQGIRYYYKHGRGAENREEETERAITSELEAYGLDGDEEWQIRKRVEKKYASRRGIAYFAALFALINSSWILNMIFVPEYWRWGSNHIPNAAFWGMLLSLLCLRYYFKHGSGAEKQAAEIEGEITRQLRVSEMREQDRQTRLYDEAVEDYELDGMTDTVRLNDEGELSDSFIGETERRRAKRGQA